MDNESGKALLAEFSSAWNAHDIERMMGCMAQDCKFLASAGPHCEGERHVGIDAVRQAFEAILHSMPDARWNGKGLFVDEDTAFSLWTLTGTRGDGVTIEVDGIDHFVLEAGKIKMKNAFRKERVSPASSSPKSDR